MKNHLIKKEKLCYDVVIIHIESIEGVIDFHEKDYENHRENE